MTQITCKVLGGDEIGSCEWGAIPTVTLKIATIVEREVRSPNGAKIIVACNGKQAIAMFDTNDERFETNIRTALDELKSMGAHRTLPEGVAQLIASP